jgi:hypothetical protein
MISTLESESVEVSSCPSQGVLLKLNRMVPKPPESKN